jgi:hypothetical protein
MFWSISQSSGTDNNDFPRPLLPPRHLSVDELGKVKANPSAARHVRARRRAYVEVELTLTNRPASSFLSFAKALPPPLASARRLPRLKSRV